MTAEPRGVWSELWLSGGSRLPTLPGHAALGNSPLVWVTCLFFISDTKAMTDPA